MNIFLHKCLKQQIPSDIFKNKNIDTFPTLGFMVKSVSRNEGLKGYVVESISLDCLIHWFFIWLMFVQVVVHDPSHGADTLILTGVGIDKSFALSIVVQKQPFIGFCTLPCFILMLLLLSI